MFRFLLIAILMVTIAGCGGFPALRDANRTKLSTLEPDMPRAQVLSIMGPDGFMEIKNPYKRESFAIGQDKYEVLYYYTDFIQEYQPIDTGMTPVVLKNGKFIGAGKEFLFKVR